MAVKDKIINNLSDADFRDLREARRNIFHFATGVKIIHSKRGKIPFNLYPYQIAVLLAFLQNRFNIIKKFRQAGLTELISMYCLWFAMYHDHKNILIISIKDRVAKKVLRRIKFMYKNLPEHWKVPIVNGRGEDLGTASEIEFANGSMISSQPTTEDAGRSEAVSLLIVDEAAILRWMSRIWAGIWPTLSCSVGTTPILVKKDYIEVKQLKDLCPKKEGIIDISHLGLKTLTHTGKWQNILLAQNKGELKTWYVEDCKGKIGGYTPAHRLYTTKGWKTVREIIEDNLNVISVETGLDDLQPVPITTPPPLEIIEPIKDFPLFRVSNLGRVYKESGDNFKLVKPRENKDGYLRVFLTRTGVKRGGLNKSNAHKSKVFPQSIASLVYGTFIGELPQGYEIDHINCNRQDNYSTNLLAITKSCNVEKSFKHNIGAKLSSISNDKLPQLKKRGRILEMYSEGYSFKEIAEEVYHDKLQGTKFVKRILTKRKSRVYISKLRVIKRTIEPIYDINVENDNSYISADNYVNHNTGGSAIINSTPYGIGNWYHGIWVGACARGNPFNAINLKWQMHPERDEKWYLEQAAVLGPRRTAQEVDGDFLASGNNVFDLADIKAIEDEMLLEEMYILETEMNEMFRLYKEPKKNEQYFIGADVSTGRSSDYSAFSIMNTKGEEFASFKGRVPTNRLTELMMIKGRLFNDALLGPEINDVGEAVLSKMQDEGYPYLYNHVALVKQKGDKKPKEEKRPGWLTTPKLRPIIINELEEDIRLDKVIIKDQEFVREAYTFIYDSNNKPVAMGKGNKSEDDTAEDDETYSDDSIMAKAITNHMRKKKYNTNIILPK